MKKILNIFWAILILMAGLPVLAQDPDPPPSPPAPAEEQISKEPEPKEENKTDKKVKEKAPKGAKSSVILGFLSKFSLGVSGGYSQTYYSHSLNGFGIYQPEGGTGVFIFDNSSAGQSTIPTIYTGWFNNPQGIGGLVIPVDTLPNPIITNGIPIFPGDLVVNTDSIPVGYKATSHGIPLTATIHVEFDRYRIGGGATIEFNKMGNFRPNALKDTLRGFEPGFSFATFKRYFGFVGISVYESWQYKMLADLQVGKINRGKNFSPDLITGILFFNAGFTVEKSLSEYFKIFARPSLEWKSFTVTSPEAGIQITHLQPSVAIQFGARVGLPDLGRCPVKGCKIQINHVHEGREFRSRVHPLWKWQDPNYGQNYPKPLKKY